MVGMGMALLPQLLVIESQMAPYLGGIVQQIVLTLIIFLPIIRFTPRRSLNSTRNVTLAGAQVDRPAPFSKMMDKPFYPTEE